MGTVFEVDVYEGKADMDEAYQSRVEHAFYEYGHDPYNGTISTTNGAKQMTSTLMTINEAGDWANEHIDDVNKWEEAGAIPLKDERTGWYFFFWAAC